MTLLAIHLPDWALRLLGLPPGIYGKTDRFTPAFATGWTPLAATTLLVGAGLWFGYHYWRDGSRVSWWLKAPLVLLRLIALAALIVMLGQPTLRLHQVDTVRPSVAILVDNSDSMARPDPRLPAAYAGRESAASGLPAAQVARTTRLERANALLNHAHALTELSKKYNVRLYSFAGAPHALPLPADAAKRRGYQVALSPDEATGDTTQIGAALRRPLEDLAGQPLAGAIVLSDGVNNQGEDPTGVAQAARQTGLPVSTLGLGDPTKTKDVALLSVLADDTVRVNNTVTVYAALSQRGYRGKTVAVTLTRGSEVVGRQTLRLGPDEQKQEVHFTYVPTQGGRFHYAVTAQLLPGEVDRTNNRRVFDQDVISKRLKVLYVEGEPRYEFRYLKNAILRDTSLDFACLLLSGDDELQGGQGNIAVKGFPATEKALFEYDIIVLGDVPRTYFSQTQLEAIRRFVEDRGASLLVIAGEQHMPHEYAGTPLEAVLPCVIGPSPDPVLTEEAFAWQITPEGKRSPILQLEDDEATNDRTWRTLPGMFWAAGVVRAKPGATVLASHPTRRNADGPYPLVATQPFGAGKCFLQLVDSTWRWRWRVGDRYFYRYWGQVFRTLTPKELPGNSRFVQLNTDRLNSGYRLGERALLNARLLDAYYHPIKATSAVAVLTGPNGQAQKVTMQAVSGSPGLFTAQVQPERIGRYTVSLTSPANPQARAETVFNVETQALERQKPELDEPALKKIAASGGGQYYTPDKFADWMQSLKSKPLSVRSEQEIELWDAPALLLLFLLPLALEWLIRKRKGLL